MEIFKTVDDLFYVLLRQLAQSGRINSSRNGPMREIWGAAIGLSDPDKNFVTHSSRNLSPVHASAELLYYLSGSHDVSMMSHYTPSYVQYAEADGNDWAAYGHRIETNVKVMGENKEPFSVNQLELVMSMLQRDPDSRQAVVTLWAPHDLFNAAESLTKSVPCTVSWQFLIRAGALHMIASMRSNDLWLGLPYDVYVFTTIQRLIASQLGVALGTYAHFVGSLHLYDKDIEKAAKLLAMGAAGHSKVQMLNGSKANVSPAGHDYAGPAGMEGLAVALDIEERTRKGEHLSQLDYELVDSISPILSDAALICASYNQNCYVALKSPLLNRAYKDFHARRLAKGGVPS